MPKLGPISRKDLIYYLTRLGFIGPLKGKKHRIMRKDGLRIILPNPHEGDISEGLLRRILREGNIPRDQWEAL